MQGNSASGILGAVLPRSLRLIQLLLDDDHNEVHFYRVPLEVGFRQAIRFACRKFYVVLSGSVTVLRPEGRVDGKKMYQQLAVLKEGGSFGELALIQSSRRSASVLCREPTSLGVLMRQDYLRTVGKIQEQMLAKKVTLLQSNPVFAPWSRSSLLKLSYFFKERTFSRKQVLFRAGEAASEVFLVKSGDLELVKDISVPVRKSLFQLKDCDLRRQAEVMLVGLGDLLGGVEVLKEQLHRYTCVCHSLQAEVLSISRDDFLKRMTSEEAVKTVLAMSEAIEHKRGQRLQRVSDRERKTHDLSALLTSLADASLPGSVMHARMELEAEVRDRWFLPKLKKHGSPVPILTSVSPIESPKSIIFNYHHRATSELLPAQSFLKELRPGKSLKTLIAIMPNLSLHRKFLRRKAESCSRLDLDSPSAT